MELGKKKTLSVTTNCVLGSISGLGAAVFINPIEVIKTRLQLQGTNKLYDGSLDCFRKILKREGFIGLYAGLRAALLRQILYCGGRFGVYQYLEDFNKTKFGSKSSAAGRLINGSIAGGVGAFLASPAEIILVRMMGDNRLPRDQRRNYKGPMDAIIKISKEEGTTTLFRGLTPTIYKGILLNMIQLGPYYQLKEFMIENYHVQDGRLLQLYCGFIMGFISSAVTVPMDFAKSKLQEMKSEGGGKFQYKGTVDVLMQVSRTQGILKNFSGFVPYFFRIGTCNIVTFIFLEELTNLYLNYM